MITTTGRDAPAGRGSPLRRISFRFAARAGRGACLVDDDRHGLVVESWALRARHWTARPLPAAVGETMHTQPVPAEDGRVVVVRNRKGVHDVAVLGPGEEHLVARLECQALRAFPTPDPATLAWVAAFHQPERTVLHRLDAHTLELTAVLDVPGRLRGEGWLTSTGTLMAANHFAAGRRRIVVADLARGTTAPAPGLEGTLLLTGLGGRMLLTLGTSDGPRLGLASLNNAGTHVPDGLNRIPGTVWPLAFDPAGRRLALRVTDGARSRLVSYDVGGDAATEIAIPPGVINAGAWGDEGLHLLFSAPTHPSLVATVGVGGDPVDAALAELARPDPCRSDATLEQFDGPAGPIEAVVYGRDWRRAAQVLVALHGGPEAAWDLSFDPVFQRFAAAGITVIAPNQRGSTGYGAAHRDAIRNAWGGPDLADIRSVLSAVTRGRQAPGGPRPMLYGISYGAFLALLAAAADPEAWSRVAVVAPFVDGPSLYEEGQPGVRAMLDRLGGRTPVHDELGPRNLLDLCTRIRSRLLVIHGEQDGVIPVEHARRLVERIRATRPRPSGHVRYVEVPGGGHNPLDEAGGPALLDEIVDFYLGDAGTHAEAARALCLLNGAGTR